MEKQFRDNKHNKENKQKEGSRGDSGGLTLKNELSTVEDLKGFFEPRTSDEKAFSLWFQEWRVIDRTLCRRCKKNKPRADLTAHEYYVPNCLICTGVQHLEFFFNGQMPGYEHEPILRRDLFGLLMHNRHQLGRYAPTLVGYYQ